MRAICVICTELLVINSQITACNCGHIFHEECVFRWFKSGQHTCPQCRAKVNQSTLIKRLYLTEADISLTQEASSLSAGSSLENQEKLEHFLTKIQELKNELKEKNDILNNKSKQLELKESKIKELEDKSSGNKKKLSENQLLIDYLKKELENFNKLKEQYETREKNIYDLESKIKEFKSIEMIYKDHEGAFQLEMNKYLTSLTSLSHCQTIIRQLVSTNVLLKEQLDKQTEDKKLLRKKLFQMEKHQSEKEKFVTKKEQEMKELNERIKKLEQELYLKTNELSEKDKLMESFKHSPKINDSANLKLSSTPALMIGAKMSDTINSTTPIAANTSTNKMPNDDSDIQYLDEICRIETSYLKKKDDPIEIGSTASEENDSLGDMSPILRKRKNPFSKSESFPQLDNLTSMQSKNHKTLSQIVNESPEITLVRPIGSLAKRNRLETNKQSESPVLSTNQKSTTNEPASNGYFTYQYDGLGGRKKVFKNEVSKFASSSTLKNAGDTKNKKLFRFKVT